jgi:flagellar motor switch protein FliN
MSTNVNDTVDNDQWNAADSQPANSAAISVGNTSEVNELHNLQHSDVVASTFQSLSGSNSLANTPHDIELVLDIPVQLTVELGRTKVAIKDILQIAQGSVVELDAMACDPLDVFVNGCLIAQGEVVVVNDKFGIRLTDIVTPSERIRKLNR